MTPIHYRNFMYETNILTILWRFLEPSVVPIGSPFCEVHSDERRHWIIPFRNSVRDARYTSNPRHCQDTINRRFTHTHDRGNFWHVLNHVAYLSRSAFPGPTINSACRKTIMPLVNKSSRHILMCLRWSYLFYSLARGPRSTQYSMMPRWPT